MPGTVVDMKAKVGAEMAKGDPRVVSSTTKMETVVAAVVGGRVKRIAVRETLELVVPSERASVSA